MVSGASSCSSALCGYGFHPLVAFLDATGEALAGQLRPRNAGSGTATDHVAVLDQALAQLPVDPAATEITVRTDSAGCSHHFVDACSERNVRFSLGHRLTAEIATVAVTMANCAWVPAVSADGSDLRADAEVAEITGLVDLSAWPAGTRMIARREHCHPGAQLTFTDIDGRRYQPSSPMPPRVTSPTSKPSNAAGAEPNGSSVTPKTPA